MNNFVLEKKPTFDTPSLRLKGKLDLVYPALQAQAEQLWGGLHAREIYPVYLEHMHMVVRSGVPLMYAAIQAAEKLPPSDRLKKSLINYLSRHMEEERGHDVWLLEDYEATGADPQYLLAQTPTHHVANLAGAQYYWLSHHHPVMLMGHIAALGTYHPPQGFAQHLSKLTGYPIQAFRAIARHEKLDIVHKREIYEFIDELDLSPSQERAIGLSGLHTMQGAVAVLEDIEAKCKNLIQ